MTEKKVKYQETNTVHNIQTKNHHSNQIYTLAFLITLFYKVTFLQLGECRAKKNDKFK